MIIYRYTFTAEEVGIITGSGYTMLGKAVQLRALTIEEADDRFFSFIQEAFPNAGLVTLDGPVTIR